MAAEVAQAIKGNFSGGYDRRLTMRNQRKGAAKRPIRDLFAARIVA
jgi:hypothetical protein